MLFRVNAYTHKLAMLKYFTMNYHLDLFSWGSFSGNGVVDGDFR